LNSPSPTVGYCTNVHAGASLEQTRANLQKYAVRVKERFSPERPMGVGLWLSNASACELRESGGVAAFRDWLAEQGLVPYTMNGFPYGDFHQPVVKQLVYRPTWWESERLSYTNLLIDTLHELLPPGMEGSISTLPIAWPDSLSSAEQLDHAAENLLAAADHMAKLEDRTGRLIHLNIEPEPGCLLDTADDVAKFFEDRLLRVGKEQRVRRYLRVCHDVCHAAVMFEEQADVFRRYQSAGIEVGKVQVSSAVRLTLDGMAAPARAAGLEQLARFNEPKYLHQTCIRRGRETLFYEDLAPALAAARENADGELRTHFHVPIYLDRFGQLETTQSLIPACLAAAREHSTCRHFEVETYAWPVLPPELQQSDLSAGIADELRWFAQLQSRLGEAEAVGS
jgi:hypothetical protein